jgi:hypothetical protein
MLTGGDGQRNRPRDPVRLLRDLSVPLTSLVSAHDIADARHILDVHRARPVVRRVCAACDEEWPCLDALYALLITGGTATGAEHSTDGDW